MTGRHVRYLLPILLALGLSCGGPSKKPPPAKPDAPVSILIWIDPGSGLSEIDTMAACEGWKAKGIRCYLVDDEEKAHIRIYAENEKECISDERGLITLARAWKGGKILFDMKCFGTIGSPERHKFRTVMIHEIGHELGIWDHIPFDCDTGDAKKHPSGVFVCGRAVMNPMYDSEVDAITAFDRLAFDIRDRIIAVARDRLPDGHSEDPDCTYLSR